MSTTTPTPKKTSAQLAAELVQSLQQDLADSGAVASLLILPTIQRAAAIRDDIAALYLAAIADDAQKGGAA